ATVRAGENRVEVELGDLWQIGGEAAEPEHEVGEGVGVGSWRAAEAGDEPPRLAAVDELVGIAIGERRGPERRPAGPLRKATPRPRRRRAGRRRGRARCPPATRWSSRGAAGRSPARSEHVPAWCLLP